MQLSDLYDFFTPIEGACFDALKARQIACCTALEYFVPNEPEATSPLLFDKHRPRTEIKFAIGESAGIPLPIAGRRAAYGFSPALARTGELTLSLITDANAVKHRDYISQLLFLTDTLAYAMNQDGTRTQYLFIDSLSVTDCAPDYEPQEGIYKSDITCAVQFSYTKEIIDQLAELIEQFQSENQ